MIDLDLVKRQCRVDFVEDDLLLRALADAAEAEALRRIGRDEMDLLEEGAGQYPAPILQAILIRTAQLYRDPEGSEKPNITFDSLLRPYQQKL